MVTSVLIEAVPYIVTSPATSKVPASIFPVTSKLPAIRASPLYGKVGGGAGGGGIDTLKVELSPLVKVRVWVEGDEALINNEPVSAPLKLL